MAFGVSKEVIECEQGEQANTRECKEVLEALKVMHGGERYRELV
jgi:hypothetical protein